MRLAAIASRVLVALSFCLAVSSPAAGAPPRISLRLVLGGIDSPTHITNAGDGSGRLFITEQRGRVRIAKNNVLLAAPFLDIRDSVGCCGERGLLSIVFPPGYRSKKYFYVNYTDRNGDTTVSRFRLTADADVADPGSEEILLKIRQPFSNHNGGQMAFGPDGYLYIGMGDGGSAGDPYGYAQKPDTLLGKILRIDVESGKAPYSVPPTNPFLRVKGYRPEIWAVGMRNPWRFSFDRKTGDLYIADVGQDDWEEIDFQPYSSRGGQNYGWNMTEGSRCFRKPVCDKTGLTAPAVEYDHTLGCSVTGGMIYRGKDYPALSGWYLYADYCSGRIWGLKGSGKAWESHLITKTNLSISTFGEDEAGGLYAGDHARGNLYRIEAE